MAIMLQQKKNQDRDRPTNDVIRSHSNYSLNSNAD